MCGIVGYVGQRPCRDLLIAGLEKLEYRGYDSAGISLLADGEIDTVRAVGNLANLRAAVGLDADLPVTQTEGAVAVAAPPATIGLGHTRWATHGRVTEENAHPARRLLRQHPHRPQRDRREPRRAARASSRAEGHVFSSETDAEIVAHLIEKHYDGDLTDAVRDAFADLRGHYAFVAMHADHPDDAGRRAPGVPADRRARRGRDASSPRRSRPSSPRPATCSGSRTARSSPSPPTGRRSPRPTGPPVEREVEEVTWDEEAAEKGGYPTFMMKEIHEQPDAVAETIADRLPDLDRVDLSELEFPADLAQRLRRIVIVACGTSYHAGLVGRYAIEQWARVPVEMDVASEYRYRDPVVNSDDLVIGITQSGETADTLAAMRLARERGACVLAVTNVMGSQATRDADAVLFTRAGIEVGVAATKTFVSQVAAMYLLGLWLAQERGTMDAERGSPS